MQFLVKRHLKNFQRLQIALVIWYGLLKYLVFDKLTRFLTPISLEIMSVLICAVTYRLFRVILGKELVFHIRFKRHARRVHQHTGRGGWGSCSPPCWKKKINIIWAKLMYRSGKDTVKNILLFNILIYLFSSCNSPYPLSDLCTTSRDGCYYSELELWVPPRDWEW